MGSRQKAVKAFFAVVCDDTMQNRWIPDEDWSNKFKKMATSIAPFQF
jgi:hypothetical protein